jgi:hypothetical protein
MLEMPRAAPFSGAVRMMEQDLSSSRHSPRIFLVAAISL